MVDVVLVNVPHSFIGTLYGKSDEIFFYPPLGILYLASSLREHGYDVAVLDAPTMQLTMEDLTWRILQYDPKIIGLSATTPQAKSTVQLANALSQHGYNGKTVLGGSHATLDQRFMAKYPYFDVLFQGEAEVTFPNIIEHIKSGSLDGTVIKGESPKNLDSLPFPARDLTDLKSYFVPIYSEKFTAILASRGCPYRCSFCCRPCVPRTMRFRSPENIRDEIRECREQFNLKYFQFVDDIFGLNRKATFELLELLKSLDIQFGFQTRVELLRDEAYVETLRNAGCREISLGIESGDEQIRKINGKPFSDETIQQTIDLCHKYDIEVNSFYIIGLIGETETTVATSICHPKAMKTDYIEFHIIVPYPQTEIFQHALNEQALTADIWDKHISGDLAEQPIYIPKALTRDFMVQAQREAYRNFYFNPHYVMKRLLKDFSSPNKLRQDFRTAITLAKNFL